MNPISIIGATGNVGRKIVETILERNLATPSNIMLFASATSAGKTIDLKGREFTIFNAEECAFK